MSKSQASYYNYHIITDPIPTKDRDVIYRQPLSSQSNEKRNSKTLK
jgi:hypothetical protein